MAHQNPNSARSAKGQASTRRRARGRRNTQQTNSMLYQVAESFTHPISFLPTVSYSQFDVSSTSSDSDEYDFFEPPDSYDISPQPGGSSYNISGFQRGNYMYFSPYQIPISAQSSNCQYCASNISVSSPYFSCGRMTSPRFQTSGGFSATNYDPAPASRYAKISNEDAQTQTSSNQNEEYTVEEPSSDSDIENIRRNTIHTGPTIEEISD